MWWYIGAGLTAIILLSMWCSHSLWSLIEGMEREDKAKLSVHWPDCPCPECEYVRLITSIYHSPQPEKLSPLWMWEHHEYPWWLNTSEGKAIKHDLHL